MRRSMRARRGRLAGLAASLLLAGSALAAVLPAQGAQARQAAPAALPVNTVVVQAIAAQTTNPLSMTTTVPVTATESDLTGQLTFAVTSLPATATATFTITQPLAPGNATVSLTAKFTAPFTGNVTVTATAAPTAASSGGTGAKTFAWTANNTITFPALAAQTTQAGTPVTGPTIAAADNDTATVLSYTSATLPAGLAISKTTGKVSGTPTVARTYLVTVTATDGTGASATSPAFTWTITPAPIKKIVVKATAPKKAWTGVPIRVQPTATDSTPGQTLTWSARNLPAGLAISKTTGLISGRVTAQVTRTTTVTATDTGGTTGSATVVFTIGPAAIIINPGPQVTTVGKWKPLSPIKTTDGVPGDKPHYSATGLPPGMGFQVSPMLLYGWPTTPGTYTVTVHEHGSTGSVDSMTFRLTVRQAPDKGATGQIHLALDGKCLQDPGGRTSNGTPVRIEKCAPGANERWTVVADSTIRVRGRCLDIAGSRSSTGRQLQLENCGRANQRQQWIQSTDGELVNPASGLCVTDPRSSRSNGTVPVTGACHPQRYAQWTLPAQPVLTALGGYCADLHYSSGANGNIIDMFSCNGTAGQAWTFEPDGTLRMFGNKCLTLRGKKAVIWTCGATGRQKWTVDRTGTFSSALTQGGTCLAIPSLTAAKGTVLEPNGTQLIASACNRTDPRDLWHIT